jgi:hypothetical protein
MANFTQSSNPVHVQETSKLSKAQLKHIKVFARDVNNNKEYRVNRIKHYIGSSVRAIVNNGDHIIIVTNTTFGGNLPTQYFINLPKTQFTNAQITNS